MMLPLVHNWSKANLQPNVRNGSKTDTRPTELTVRFQGLWIGL